MFEIAQDSLVLIRRIWKVWEGLRWFGALGGLENHQSCAYPQPSLYILDPTHLYPYFHADIILYNLITDYSIPLVRPRVCTYILILRGRSLYPCYTPSLVEEGQGNQGILPRHSAEKQATQPRSINHRTQKHKHAHTPKQSTQSAHER